MAAGGQVYQRKAEGKMSAQVYQVTENGDEVGAFTAEEIRERLLRGDLGQEAEVYIPGSGVFTAVEIVKKIEYAERLQAGRGSQGRTPRRPAVTGRYWQKTASDACGVLALIALPVGIFAAPFTAFGVVILSAAMGFLTLWILFGIWNTLERIADK